MTHPTDDELGASNGDTLEVFWSALETADRVVIEKRNALDCMDAHYFPAPELRAAPLRACKSGGWQPEETAPRDGTVILMRNADHPYFGVGACLRHVEWSVDPKTGAEICNDLGSWILICDNDLSFGQSKAASAPIAISADEYNKNVRREWMPLGTLDPAPDARQEGWRAGIEAAAKTVKALGPAFEYKAAATAIRALADKGPDRE